LHCSIIGTCFSTGELRQVVGRIGYKDFDKRSEHDLHSLAVGLAGKQHEGAKVLHKALDRKFKSVIARFEEAKSVASLDALWRNFLERGEIPAAYWATLTHRNADEPLIQKVFGEVHMLSHLVGAANRADIRRLTQMESEIASLQETIARQQAQLRDSLVKRDETIRTLRTQLGEAIAIGHRSLAAAPQMPADAKDAVIADLDRRLKHQEGLRARSEERLPSLHAELSAEQKLRQQAERLAIDLKSEIEFLERTCLGTSQCERQAESLKGKTLLYVGGRSNHVSQLRRLAEERGAKLLHHDGGIEESSDVLPSLASKADAILFPVDCVSHAAVGIIKRTCRNAQKPYLPLRSSGLGSFIAALNDSRRIIGGEVQSNGLAQLVP
jgi:hypothetical protein